MKLILFGRSSKDPNQVRFGQSDLSKELAWGDTVVAVYQVKDPVVEQHQNVAWFNLAVQFRHTPDFSLGHRKVQSFDKIRDE